RVTYGPIAGGNAVDAVSFSQSNIRGERLVPQEVGDLVGINKIDPGDSKQRAQYETCRHELRVHDRRREARSERRDDSGHLYPGPRRDLQKVYSPGRIRTPPPFPGANGCSLFKIPKPVR